MDKGIRPAVVQKFAELLPQRAELGNTGFRKSVMSYLMDEFSITLGAASTHYNYAFIQAKKDPALLPLLEGLGRPEDKKGGRKPKAKPVLGNIDPIEFIDQQYLDCVAAAAGAIGPMEAVVDQVPNAGAEQQLFTVVKAKDGTVVATGLTAEAAAELISKAAAQKKAKLQLA
jgi:hypothetical protein